MSELTPKQEVLQLCARGEALSTACSEEELAALRAQPDIGMGDRSKCAPDWIRLLSRIFTECQEYREDNPATKDGKTVILKDRDASGILHTLIAMRVRTIRLRIERDTYRAQLEEAQRLLRMQPAKEAQPCTSQPKTSDAGSADSEPGSS